MRLERIHQTTGRADWQSSAYNMLYMNSFNNLEMRTLSLPTIETCGISALNLPFGEIATGLKAEELHGSSGDISSS